MFTVFLAVIALADYVIIFYSIVNMVAKPTIETAETQTLNDFSEGDIMEYIDNNGEFNDNEFDGNDEEFNEYIEEQNARIALLSVNVDKILSNIDSIIEKSKFNQGVLVK